MRPAKIGDERLVPPIRYSSYCTPSGKVCVWPTRNPVLGSPMAAPSRTPPPPMFRADWYQGFGKTTLTPPPDPYSQPVRVHAWVVLLQLYVLVPQPVSCARVLFCVTPRLVPPTAVPHGLEAGQSVVGNPNVELSSPLSPDEKKTPGPPGAASLG